MQLCWPTKSAKVAGIKWDWPISVPVACSHFPLSRTHCHAPIPFSRPALRCTAALLNFRFGCKVIYAIKIISFKWSIIQLAFRAVVVAASLCPTTVGVATPLRRKHPLTLAAPRKIMLCWPVYMPWNPSLSGHR